MRFWLEGHVYICAYSASPALSPPWAMYTLDQARHDMPRSNPIHILCVVVGLTILAPIATTGHVELCLQRLYNKGYSSVCESVSVQLGLPRECTLIPAKVLLECTGSLETLGHFQTNISITLTIKHKHISGTANFTH